MKRRTNVLLKVALALIGILLVARIFARSTTETFTSLFTDEDKKKLLCKNNACPQQDKACLDNCFNNLKNVLVCPGSVMSIDRTDASGIKWSVVNGIQCIHA